MKTVMATDIRPGNLVFGLDGSIPLFVKSIKNMTFEVVTLECVYSQDSWSSFETTISANSTFNVK